MPLHLYTASTIDKRAHLLLWNSLPEATAPFDLARPDPILTPVSVSLVMEPEHPCDRCQNENHMEYFPIWSIAHRMYIRGEVVRIKESINNLVQHGIFEDTALLLKYTGFTFDTHTPCSAEDYRLRPALLLKSRKVTEPTDSDIVSTVLLFATFEGKAPLRVDLPRVLQWFCLPIAPHSAVQAMTEEDHIHTSPEWNNSRRIQNGPIDAWLVARQFLSNGNVDRRWGNVNSTRRSSAFIVEENILEDILEMVEDLWESWVEECQKSKDVLKEYQREYLECLAAIEKKQAAIQQSEAKKVDEAEGAVQGQAPAGTSTVQQGASVAISSSQELRQVTPVAPNRSYASVLAAGSKQKVVKPADSLQSLFAPKKESGTQPPRTADTEDPAGHGNAQCTDIQNANDSADGSKGPKLDKKGKTVTVSA